MIAGIAVMVSKIGRIEARIDTNLMEGNYYCD